jgi:hypothetical protein
MRARSFFWPLLRLCDGRDGDRQHAGVSPSPRPVTQAFVIVPIVGAFFIDLINLAVLTFYLWPRFIVGR